MQYMLVWMMNFLVLTTPPSVNTVRKFTDRTQLIVHTIQKLVDCAHHTHCMAIWSCAHCSNMLMCSLYTLYNNMSTIWKTLYNYGIISYKINMFQHCFENGFQMSVNAKCGGPYIIRIWIAIRLISWRCHSFLGECA